MYPVVPDVKLVYAQVEDDGLVLDLVRLQGADPNAPMLRVVLDADSVRSLDNLFAQRAQRGELDVERRAAGLDVKGVQR